MTTTRENWGGNAPGLRGFSSVQQTLAELGGVIPELDTKRPKGRLLAAVKRGATELKISEKSVFLLDQLMSFTQQQDWEPGHRPIVWPSNDLLGDALGLSKRAVQYRLTALIDDGLIVAVDSPAGRRYGRRGPDKHIIEAYGFDLSPIALRYEEFVAAGELAAARRKERARLRRQRTIAFKSIRMIVATALELGLEAVEWSSIGDNAKTVANEARKPVAIDELRKLVDRLANLRADAEAHFQTQSQLLITQSQEEVTAPKGAKDCALITTTTDLQSNKLDTVDGSAPEKGQPEKSSSSIEATDQVKKPSDGLDPVEATITKYRIPPKLVARVGGMWFDQYMPKDCEIDWLHIEKAGSIVRKFAGISDHAWDEAIRTVGPVMGAAMVAVILAKAGGTSKQAPIRSKGGYFRGMVRKAAAGELNLGPTFYALQDELNERERKAAL